MGEQEAPQLTVAEQVAELGCRHIDQEQDQYPKLDCHEAMPGESRHHVRQEVAHTVALDEPEPDEMLEQPSDEHYSPVHDRLEQYWLDQRRPIVAAEKGQRVGDQHRLADDECRGGGKHEVAKRGE